ncbi:MAG TPA: HupE/UreJ family protein [Prosthecobacter sp.]|nr:HupE/UreJ family protein [Prosthecobacter sp.]
MPRHPLRLLLALFGLLLCLPALAHPLPDIPVRAAFDSGGRCRIQVEVDPRCFDADPNIAPSMLQETLLETPEDERAALKTQAQEYVRKAVAIFFEPLGRQTPEFAFDFTTHEAVPLANKDDIVVLTGTWETFLPPDVRNYRVEALPEGTLSVVFENSIDGKKVERFQVLFPGEKSYSLELAPLNAGWWAIFASFAQEGFSHVLPNGLDHMLFVLGLLFLSRAWQPLLMQVMAFTVAHTLTLGLATLGWLHLQESVIEQITALSVAAVGISNLLHPRYTAWRSLIVFAFGLVHGLAFAEALRGMDLQNASLVVPLLGYNIGVEGGQLTVIAVALSATWPIKDPKIYRKYVAVPGSVIIAAIGLWWTAQRLLGPA